MSDDKSFSAAFFEQFSLYASFKHEMPSFVSELTFPALHMRCDTCAVERTFSVIGPSVVGGLGGGPAAGLKPRPDLPGSIQRITYHCAACKKDYRHFFLRFDSKLKWVMKVGQWPELDVSVPDEIRRAFASRQEDLRMYTQARKLQAHGYGIGAFAYYRRIIENRIGELLEKIIEIMTPEQRVQYEEILEQVRATPVAETKIRLVKDLLPASLTPGGFNPLAVIYDTLSEGLHGMSDEECLYDAEALRSALEFFVRELVSASALAKEFTTSMKQLLDRKRERAQREEQKRQRPPQSGPDTSKVAETPPQGDSKARLGGESEGSEIALDRESDASEVVASPKSRRGRPPRRIAGSDAQGE